MYLYKYYDEEEAGWGRGRKAKEVFPRGELIIEETNFFHIKNGTLLRSRVKLSFTYKNIQFRSAKICVTTRKRHSDTWTTLPQNPKLWKQKQSSYPTCTETFTAQYLTLKLKPISKPSFQLKILLAQTLEITKPDTKVNLKV